MEFWVEKGWHQNQDRAKRWKIEFLNVFWIEFWIEKSCRQKLRSCQKLEKSIFEYFFKLKFE